MTAFKISFEPMQEVIECTAGETILEAARRERVRISSSCGGHGTCMSCAVQVTEGALPSAHEADAQVFSDRRLGEGWRRACITEPIGDCTISVPARSTATPVRTQVDGLSNDMAKLVDFEPAVK
ncbi:MAG: 2Fe-2S iron-sulfur cluster binding domain-containing protein, partial [Rhodospirillales bacterium]|nr:2Fe-2S iron-sulfur cluster binding domain-containing protein [Rhodospirillales bacterium]